MIPRLVVPKRILLVWLWMVAAPLVIQAQEEGVPSNEGALFLLLPVGAQAVATGRTMTARPGAESAFWNPAGLGALEKGRFLVLSGDQVAGESTAISALWVKPLVGVFGLSWQLLDLGEIPLTDDQGNVLGQIELRNHIGIVSFATTVLPWLRAGLNLKFIQENFDCNGPCEGIGVRSNGWAVDAGIQVSRPAGLPIRVGVMAAHLGPDFQVENASQADPLPSRLRVSAGYEVLSSVEARDVRLWLNVEIEDRWKNLGEERSYYWGAELEAGRTDVIFIRAGYVDAESGLADGFAVGVGLRYERFELSLGKNLAGSITGESEPVHVSFGVVF